MKSLLMQFLTVLAAIALALIAYDHFKRPEVIAAKAQAEALRQQAEALQQKLAATSEQMEAQTAAMKQQADAQAAEMKQQADAMTQQATALKNEVESEHHVAEVERQHYTMHSYLAEGLSAASQAKVAIAESYMNSGKLPASNHEAGLPEAAQFKGRSLNRLEVSRGGVITLTYDAQNGVGGGTIRLVPDVSNLAMGVSWQCTSPAFVDIAASVPQCEYRAPKE